MNSPAALLDSLLLDYRDDLGADYQAYRNHCQRVYALTRRIATADAGWSEDDDEALQVALAFHDLGIWVSHTFDYLAPSAALARNYLQEKEQSSRIALVEAMIVEHHRLRSTATVNDSRLPEYLRRADLIDVSLGMVRFGLPYAEYRQLKKHYPVQGFHGRLVSFTLHWWLRNPLRPLPMMRW